MKIIIFLTFILALLFSCNTEKDLESNSAELSYKRKKIIEIGLKYQNLGFGFGIDKDKIESWSDKKIDQFDLNVWEQCLKNYAEVEDNHNKALSTYQCDNLKERRIEIFRKEVYNDFLEFEKLNKKAITVCDSLREKRNTEVNQVMQPLKQMFEKLAQVDQRK